MQINSYLARHIGSVCKNSDVLEGGGAESHLLSRTELDSHANMPVVGCNAYVISTSKETASVAPYTPDYEAMEVPIVDAAVLYECPYSGNRIILIVRNALYVPAMRNNLIPPFIMREKGVVVNDVPKIQLEDPDESDYSLEFPEIKLRIPLKLWGIFSYLPT